jgi:Tfp pilus assembly protein PilO
MDLRTPLATKVVGGIGLLAVAGLGWTLVVGPETDDLASARETLSATQDQNALLGVQLAQLERQRDDLASTRRTARQLARQFPPTAAQPELFEQVSVAATAAGIPPSDVTALTPTPPTLGDAAASTDAAAATTGTDAPAPASGIARQTVTVTVTGSFDQTQALLEHLEHLPRAYLITAVSVAGDSTDGEYSTTVTGDMFVLAPVTDPGPALPMSGSTTPED